MKYAALILSLIFCVQAQPCTTFGILLNQNRLVGKNYDWYMSQGLVYINKKNMKKTALALYPTDKPAQWVSKYGSLTFNQFGFEFPNGGLNENGLAIEIMWLDGSVYPTPDQRESLNELQWIQYMLDNYGSVAELIANADQVRISNVAAPVHYMACDRTGVCATLEYIDGKLVMHSKDAGLTVPVLTNSTYEDSVNELKRYMGFGGNKPIPDDVSSLSRFVRASARLQQVQDIPSAMRKQAFTILNSVMNPDDDGTVWQIVYDLAGKQVHFKTREHQAIKTVDFNFNSSCKTPAQYLDMQTLKEGNVTSEFANFDAAKNRELVVKSVGALELPIDKEVIIKIVSGYPSTNTLCVE